MDLLTHIGKKIIPRRVFSFFQPLYHWKLALLGALFYRFPSRRIRVIAITGTKGKSSTAEFVNAIFEAAGHKTALASTIRFKIGDKSERNLFKMTMPGRFFIQKFLRNAVNAGCDTAVVEMTSEGARQSRHKFIDLDALIFLNLAPEHIESHGSYKKYVAAKLKLAEALQNSPKEKRVLIVNADDKEASRFLTYQIPEKISFGLKNAEPYEARSEGSAFSFQRAQISLQLPGAFSIYNAYAAAACAHAFGISAEIIKKGLESVKIIRGRAEAISSNKGFDVIVDYAHTPDSLRALYEAYPNKRKICVLGNTGGGRDTWKRPEMGGIAEKYCDEIILTNEDPYDEDPQKIIDDMAAGMSIKKPKIVLDRREAIREAIKLASTLNPSAETDGSGTANNNNRIVVISGKGTDPYVMGPNGSKIPWDDASIVREELE
ncbi:MAG: hypothetical protein A2928_00290 [Candidatus Taylorbacteria bacterium RIFCSPLOWO2_01_FULL_45_15b]|uniref:UDP-N-acetylmuramoyl-L-alanyl-D-glutamate--2, 6-diaminopimelate ligase n=1 Tax=Candidatus Taylorbacteria bacterium RIFCSPLOWO2_01_FULL_45_15b TaxID=1802319 RepID=A0A1G2N7C3_9BACT|nr:MAG: hypothetical protein A2928_00290 [Candidatus Taylorbacteria bacterium RIFCSPLOWO2_01_FULL_45_15b]